MFLQDCQDKTKLFVHQCVHYLFLHVYSTKLFDKSFPKRKKKQTWHMTLGKTQVHDWFSCLSSSMQAYGHTRNLLGHWSKIFKSNWVVSCIVVANAWIKMCSIFIKHNFTCFNCEMTKTSLNIFTSCFYWTMRILTPYMLAVKTYLPTSSHQSQNICILVWHKYQPPHFTRFRSLTNT